MSRAQQGLQVPAPQPGSSEVGSIVTRSCSKGQEELGLCNALLCLCGVLQCRLSRVAAGVWLDFSRVGSGLTSGCLREGKSSRSCAAFYDLALEVPW